MTDNSNHIAHAANFIRSRNLEFVLADNPKSICPHCHQVLELFETTEPGCVSRERILPVENSVNESTGAFIYDDGDMIPLDKESAFAPIDRFDRELSQGTCPSCDGLYCTVFLHVSSRPIRTEVNRQGEPFFFVDSEISFEGYRNVFSPVLKGEIPFSIPWIVVRHNNAHLDFDPDLSLCIIDEHIIGPFPLTVQENLAEEIGVAACMGALDRFRKNIWLAAEDIVLAAGPFAMKLIETDTADLSNTKI